MALFTLVPRSQHIPRTYLSITGSWYLLFPCPHIPHLYKQFLIKGNIQLPCDPAITFFSPFSIVPSSLRVFQVSLAKPVSGTDPETCSFIYNPQRLLKMSTCQRPIRASGTIQDYAIQ